VLPPYAPRVQVPNVTRKEYQLVNIDDGYLSLMDMDSAATREDITLPDSDVGKAIQAMWDAEGDGIVTILGAIGKVRSLSATRAPFLFS